METSTRFRKNFVRRIERSNRQKQVLTILASVVLFLMFVPVIQAVSWWLFTPTPDVDLFS